MSLVLFAPVSAHRAEVGIMLLMASQLAPAAGEAFVLRCNGFVSACDRDFEVQSSGVRVVDQCVRCMREQRDFASALGLSLVELGSFIEPADLEALQLQKINGRQRNYPDEIGYISPIPANLLSDNMRRMRGESAALLNQAFRKFVGRAEPKVVFVAGAVEFMSSIVAGISNQSGAKVVVFGWDAPQNLVVIRIVGTDVVINCPFVVEDLSRVKVDPRSWPKELIALFEQLKAAVESNGPGEQHVQGA